MRMFIALIALIMLASGAHACNPNNSGFIKCPTGYCTTRSGPDAFTINAANQAVVTADLCPGALVEVYGNKQFPAGYATFDYTFEVNNSGGAIFQALDISNEQTLPKADPTINPLNGTATIMDFGVPVTLRWGYFN